MQRIGNLYEQFCSFDNLLLAYKQAKKGSRKNQETACFFFNAETELLALKEDLQNLTYQPQPYRYFYINDPKNRLISVASFRDRVVHHALVNVLAPIYEKCFIYDSYATRKHKGVHKALSRAQYFLQKNDWFFKSDVEKFFDSIDHQILLNLIARKIKDKNLFTVIKRIVGNGGQNGIGLPIGNLTSQFFANVYLTPFDYFVKETLKVKHYIRYMDDFVLFHNDKQHLKQLRKVVKDYLKQHFNLSLKENATFFNQHLNGLSFLGRRIFRAIIRLKRSNLQRVLRKMKGITQHYENKNLSESRFLASMNSYWAYFTFENSFSLKKRILQSAKHT